ncbi:unnamed protein product [Arctogadus glacialis]
MSGRPQGDSTAQTTSNLTPEATEFQPQAATPAPGGDDEIGEQSQWTSDEDREDAELEIASHDGEVGTAHS